ncbi:MAG TPA: hypothetical protein VM695_07770 [Phycisphaerae bacterium]|nr:hypothetical protein [Phycisphaerae bacterium]
MPEPQPQPTPETPSARRSIELGVLSVLLIVFFFVSFLRHNPFSLSGEALSRSIGTILGAGLTLVIYSFLYRDNPLFKVAENLYVGVTLGYGAIMTWRMALREEVYRPLLLAPTSEALGQALLHRTVPILLGVLLVMRISRKRSWLSRYAYCPLVGWGAGVGISLSVHTYVLQQLHAAIAPLQQAVQNGSLDPLTWGWFANAFFPVAGSLAVLIGTVAVLFYFFFSVEHGPVGRGVSKVGIWFLMVSFGASFGNTVMARLSLLIGRVQFLLDDWLKLK